MTEVLFDIPAEETSEPGAPDTIVHSCDYLQLPDGTLEYHYNFLVYTWHISEERVLARSYLDEPGAVSVFVSCDRLQGDPALQPLVRYLQRRYNSIQSFHADDHGTGYRVAFRRRRASSGE